MSSALRSTQAPVGYFVMSGNTIDSSGHGLYTLHSATLYNNDGTVSTPAECRFSNLFKADLFDGDTATAASVTLKDLGVTVYGAVLKDSTGSVTHGVSDVRKVAIASGNSASANADTAYYVTLGTNLRNTTTDYVSSLAPSVALVGKL